LAEFTSSTLAGEDATPLVSPDELRPLPEGLLPASIIRLIPERAGEQTGRGHLVRLAV